MWVYLSVFLVLSVISTIMGISNQAKESATPPPPSYLSFRRNYVIIYCLMMAGDWLQGPYVFALYDAYGFTVKEIGILFITGFGSSLIFGTIVGSLADQLGRKKACLLYCLIYICSCMTKHFSHLGILLLGRLFGGIATSLLFSAFESWLIAESVKQGFHGVLLGEIFSQAVFYGNGLTAILSGLLANLMRLLSFF
jgi:MFS transporter, MFS domain-containing protein family, molybdate-anion transporter